MHAIHQLVHLKNRELNYWDSSSTALNDREIMWRNRARKSQQRIFFVVHDQQLGTKTSVPTICLASVAIFSSDDDGNVFSAELVRAAARKAG